ncbi:hypothetical protein OC845_003493 [Tilletia horrida]|nr:hypothetical protein OC845_003493 [Tilletia horrida]
MLHVTNFSRVLSPTRSIDVASTSFSARLAAQKSVRHTPAAVARLGQTLAASRSSRSLNSPLLRAGTGGNNYTGAVGLMQTVHRQIRSIHHAHLYFAQSPNSKPPRPHPPGVCIAPTYLMPETYELVSRDNTSDSWLWLKPGNKFSRITVYNEMTTEEEHTKEVEELTQHNKTLSWILTDELGASKTTFVPVEKPNSDEPLGVHMLEFRVGSEDDAEKDGEADDDAEARTEAPSPRPQKPSTDSGMGTPYWTSDMLGSLNDPKVRKARKEAHQKLVKPPKPTFKRSVREGVHRRRPESGLNWLNRMLRKPPKSKPK